MAKSLIICGLICIAIGVAWPFITKLGLGHLPGDFRVARKGFVFHFPFMTCLIISIVISIVLWIFRR